MRLEEECQLSKSRIMLCRRSCVEISAACYGTDLTSAAVSIQHVRPKMRRNVNGF